MISPKIFKSRKVIIGAAGIALIVGGLLVGQVGGETPDAKELSAKETAAGAPASGKTVHVEAVEAKSDFLAETQKTIGTVYSYESVQIKPEIDGKIVSIDFRDGQAVKAGDVLFRLDSSVQRAALAQANANMELSSNNIERYEELRKKGFASPMKLDEARAQLNLARANAQLAQANLAKTSIKAPFDGVLGIRRVSLGNYVQSGDTLVNLDQKDKMKVEFSLPERFLHRLKAGDTVQIFSDTKSKPIAGQVSAIESRISEQSRSILFQVVVKNTDNALYSGQFVDVTVPITKNDETVLIPDQALIPIGRQVFVYKVVDGKAVRTEVKIGSRTETEAQIIEGIEPGEIIVTAGHQKLSDGTAVRVSEPSYIEFTPMVEEKQIGIQR